MGPKVCQTENTFQVENVVVVKVEEVCLCGEYAFVEGGLVSFRVQANRVVISLVLYERRKRGQFKVALSVQTRQTFLRTKIGGQLALLLARIDRVRRHWR